MNYARMSSRMGENYRLGAEYGCAVQRFKTSKERNWQLAHRALYVVYALAVAAALAFSNLGAA